ncbi:MAG: hypothetical protein IJ906_00150, partial [Oscillospiraceae bacterium]|nr:hypothetical protein [Oscillospiraceae bacterium]
QRQRAAAPVLLRGVCCTVLMSAMPIGSRRVGKAGSAKPPPHIRATACRCSRLASRSLLHRTNVRNAHRLTPSGQSWVCKASTTHPCDSVPLLPSCFETAAAPY